MEGFQKLFTELDERIKKLEKQMDFLISRFNELENRVQEHAWKITSLQPNE